MHVGRRVRVRRPVYCTGPPRSVRIGHACASRVSSSARESRLWATQADTRVRAAVGLLEASTWPTGKGGGIGMRVRVRRPRAVAVQVDGAGQQVVQ